MKEFQYQKQQLERKFIELKKEKGLIQSQFKQMDEALRYFNDLIQKSKMLQSSKHNESRIDEFISLLRGIHQLLQLLIQQRSVDFERLMAEDAKHNHLQQDSTSSCGSNSTGNYNFIIQGSSLYQPKHALQNSPQLRQSEKEFMMMQKAKNGNVLKKSSSGMM